MMRMGFKAPLDREQEVEACVVEDTVSPTHIMGKKKNLPMQRSTHWVAQAADTQVIKKFEVRRLRNFIHERRKQLV